MSNTRPTLQSPTNPSWNCLMWYSQWYCIPWTIFLPNWGNFYFHHNELLARAKRFSKLLSVHRLAPGQDVSSFVLSNDGFCQPVLLRKSRHFFESIILRTIVLITVRTFHFKVHWTTACTGCMNIQQAEWANATKAMSMKHNFLTHRSLSPDIKICTYRLCWVCRWCVVKITALRRVIGVNIDSPLNRASCICTPP